ncbi:hypothetical protein THAOC_23880, partial [Thalassiosira oceanica]
PRDPPFGTSGPVTAPLPAAGDSRRPFPGAVRLERDRPEFRADPEPPDFVPPGRGAEAAPPAVGRRRGGGGRAVLEDVREAAAPSALPPAAAARPRRRPSPSDGHVGALGRGRLRHGPPANGSRSGRVRTT